LPRGSLLELGILKSVRVQEAAIENILRKAAKDAKADAKKTDLP